MDMLGPRYKIPGTPIIAMIVVVLLAFGGRATAVINQYLNIIPIPLMPQGPVEEEEERHGKSAAKSHAADRRHRDRVPTPRLGILCARLDAQAYRSIRAVVAARVLPETEPDHRNGIGAPLRC